MTTQSPSLEVVSNHSGSPTGAEGTGAERRRLPRLSLTSEQFRLTANGKIFSVADLSEEGMALRVLEKNDFHLFPVGMAIEGTLKVSARKVSVKARVKHLGPDLIGCQFEQLDPSAIETLKALLDPSVLAKDLRLTPAASHDMGTLWYHGTSGTDVIVRHGKGGTIDGLSVFVFGTYVQWDIARGLETGVARSADQRDEVHGVVRLETMILDRDSANDPGKLKVAKTLILSSNLPEDLKKFFQGVL